MEGGDDGEDTRFEDYPLFEKNKEAKDFTEQDKK